MTALCIPRRSRDSPELRAKIQLFWSPFTNPTLELVSHVPPELAIAHCGMMVEMFDMLEIEALNRVYRPLFDGLDAFTLARRLWSVWSAPGSYIRLQERRGPAVPIINRLPCPHWHPDRKEPDQDSQTSLRLVSDMGAPG